MSFGRAVILLDYQQKSNRSRIENIMSKFEFDRACFERAEVSANVQTSMLNSGYI